MEPPLPPGTVAVSLQANQEGSTPLFFGIQPNARVDLIQVLKKEKGEQYAEVVAEDVLVVAIGDRMRDEHGTTLALTQADAAKVRLAQQNGASFSITPFRRRDADNDKPKLTYEALKAGADEDR